MLLTSSASFGEVEKINLWHTVPKVKGAQYLFIGFQEAELVRPKLGEWLPKALLNISENDEVYYAIENVTRENLTMNLQLFVYNKSTEKKITISWQWTLPTGMDDVEIVATEQGIIEVSYPKTGETRKVQLACVQDTTKAKDDFKISSSAPLWEWRALPWGDLKK